jgi:hypothetical protein
MGTKIVVAVALLLSSPAAAVENVTISTTATSNGTLSSGVFTPTGDNANLNITDLLNALALSNVKVTSGTTGSQTGDITVQTAVNWSANTLSLFAHHSVILTASMKPTSTGSISLKTAHGGDLSLQGGRIIFFGTGGSLTINSVSYVLVTDIPTLATDISGNPSGAFALANNYDASTGPTYAHPPIPTTFTGSFEGLGNHISNLKIIDSSMDNAALFANVGTGGSIDNVSLVNVYASTSTNHAFAAGLVAINQGILSNISVSGQVIGADYGMLGGVASYNEVGTVENSNSSVSVTAGIDGAGGSLVGYSTGTVSNCSASGAVTSAASAPYIGGLGPIDIQDSQS